MSYTTSPTETSSSPVPSTFDPVPQLCAELNLPERSIRATIGLADEGATVPFIARYRKEATHGLDEVQIRAVLERRAYLIELEDRRKSVIAEIEKQGKLTPALRAKLEAAATKADVEDLYLPYKPKRRTRAMIALERGLGALAEQIWEQGSEGVPNEVARAFVAPDKEVPDEKSALAGARDIIAERLAEDPDLRKAARDVYLTTGVLTVEKTAAYQDKVTKFDNYEAFSEPVANIASHRFLAVRRGETEGILRSRLTIDEESFISLVERKSPHRESSPWAFELKTACRDAVSRILLTSAQVDVRVELKMRSDKQAIEVFATNLRELLMAPPLGARAVLGIDPGQRTGCKCAVVDRTGKLLAHETIYLVGSAEQLRRAELSLLQMLKAHPVQAIAVGNGTHGRETEAFVKGLLKQASSADNTFCVSVSESGASVYSASDVAREEFPDLDLTVRGAISIARRLQDPLAELVKVDPKSIGVGQYQHDVFQGALSKKLGDVVESCVHEVGVELNTASAPLLARVSGIGESLARRIVTHRNTHGAFKDRKQLLAVSGLGPRAFEQAAGFLRINGADNPLDGSAVHPERYGLVERIATDLGVPVVQLIGNRDLLSRIDEARYTSDEVGSFTLADIRAELLKPGRDPRKTFERPTFRDDVNSIQDLKLGMVLEGSVTNVTAFGAFVDIGVHQDGLVHVSKLSDRFIRDPSEVVKVGDRITVRVVEIDLERNRISLSARSGDGPSQGASGKSASTEPKGDARNRAKPQRNGPTTPLKSDTLRGSGEKLTHNPFASLMRK